MSANASRGSLREYGASILVAGLSSAFGVSLLQITGVLADVILADDVTGESGTAILMLMLTAFVFIVIAVFVASVVTVNTFATIVAGRARAIALMRLIGASARDQRRAIAGDGFVVGLIGAAAGAVVGTGLSVGLERLAVALGWAPDMPHSWFSPVLLVPVAGVVVTTWSASWIGSRPVLDVTPLQALAAAQPRSEEETRSRRGRNVASAVLFGVGLFLLAAGIVLGLFSPLGVLVALLGGILSFTGVILGAHLVMPGALRLVGKMLGRSAPARLAAANATRYPERATRTTIGVVIGVTLVTMFGVAIQSFRDIVNAARATQPEVYEGIDAVFDTTTTVFSVLVGVSALIAAVGLVNALSLSVFQRTRELGLLRALGFTRGQLRTMVLREAVQLTATAVVVGLVLGTFYGWAGAQSLLGAVTGSPGIIAPGMPWAVLLIVAVAAGLLTVAATVTPSRRATRVSPVVALAVD